MPGEDIYSWSVTAANNGNSDSSIEWREGQTRASVNNSSRSEMAAHAKDRNLKNGSITTTNSGNAYAFTSGVSYTTIPTGLRVKLKIGAAANTSAATLNMDGIGDITIKDDQGGDLHGGELILNAYTDFLYNGTNWIFLYSHAFFIDLITSGGGIIVGTQVFNTAGVSTYTPTLGMECCVIECIGGGGGGGSANAASLEYMVGAGGGSGGYSRKTATAAQIGLSQTVTVGAGGVGGAPGTTGGATSVGTLCVANGGGGGVHAQGAFGQSIPDAGAGGVPGTGDVTAAGAPGCSGFHNTNNTLAFSKNASGGAGAFGGGGRGGLGYGYPVNGLVGGNYGGGGGGGTAYYIGAGLAHGGAGSAGVIIITEFSGRGAPGFNGADGVPGPMGPPGPAGAGTGDVLVHGTPVAGQVATWFDTSHVQGVSVASIVSSFTTGDIKPTFKVVPDTGWVMLDDRTVGNASSGATNRANADTVDLFTLLWNNIANADAPVSSGRGANAAADYAANKTITLPKALGRAMMSAGAGAILTTRPLGQAIGAETVALSVANLAPHAHTYAAPTSFSGDVAAGADTGPIIWNSGPIIVSTGSTGGTAGVAVPFGIVQPSFAVNFMCKL